MSGSPPLAITNGEATRLVVTSFDSSGMALASDAPLSVMVRPASATSGVPAGGAPSTGGADGGVRPGDAPPIFTVPPLASRHVSFASGEASTTHWPFASSLEPMSLPLIDARDDEPF